MRNSINDTPCRDEDDGEDPSELLSVSDWFDPSSISRTQSTPPVFSVIASGDTQQQLPNDSTAVINVDSGNL